MESSPVNWLCDPLPGYTEPPVAPLPPLDSPEILQNMRIRPSSLGKAILFSFWKLSGFMRFYRQLTPDRLEKLLRTENLRTPGLFAPIISATILLKESQYAEHWLDRATALVMAALAFKRDLFAGRVLQDTYRGKPLEMGQYPNLFGTMLEVNNGQVIFRKNPDADAILVLVNGNFFRVPISTEFETMRYRLQRCVEIAEQAANSIANSPGSLTASTNRFQLRAWKRVLSSESNLRMLQKMRDTLFTVCLDTPIQPDSPSEAARLIHLGNPGNRFYLAGTQLVIFPNGMAGVLLNFTTYIDGNPMSRFADEIYHRSEQMLRRIATSTKDFETTVSEFNPEQIKLQIPAKIVEKSQKQIQSVQDLQPHTIVLENLGKNNFGNIKQHAVPLFVLALMTAVYELTGRIPVVEQFVSLAHFRCMGLTRQVVTTPECKAACTALYKTSFSEEIWQTVVQAVQSQRAVIRIAQQYFPLTSLEALYFKQLGNGGKILFMWLFRLRRLFMALTGQRLRWPTDVLISHPRIFDSYTIIGRPGVRLPYVRQFGLHYQIHPQKTVLIFMPGVKWRYPNHLVAVKIEKYFRKLADLAQEFAMKDDIPAPAENKSDTLQKTSE